LSLASELPMLSACKLNWQIYHLSLKLYDCLIINFSSADAMSCCSSHPFFRTPNFRMRAYNIFCGFLMQRHRDIVGKQMVYIGRKDSQDDSNATERDGTQKDSLESI
jgi:hypothetical protein